METSDYTNKLSKLTERQLEILRCFCDGMDYKTIAGELYIAIGTVKSHMGNIYEKLELDYLPVEQRRKFLFQDICPVLHIVDVQPIPAESDDPDSVPDRIMKMVEEDEYPIIPYRPSSISSRPEIVIDVPPPIPKSRRGCRTLIVGILIGVILALAVGLVLWNILGGGGQATTTSVATTIKTVSTENKAQPELPSPTPIIQEVIVVVTATSRPEIPTPRSVTPTIRPPTHTPVPTRSLDTPAGSVLEVGQSWRHEGLLLTLANVELYPSSSECNIALGFAVENRTSSTYIVTMQGDQFNLEDNLGNHWQNTGISTTISCATHFYTISGTVDPGEIFTKGGATNFYMGFFGDLTNPSVDYVIVTVMGLLNFDGAQWRVKINN